MRAGSNSQQLNRIRFATGFEQGSNWVRTGFEQAGTVQPLIISKDRTGFELRSNRVRTGWNGIATDTN